MSKATFSVADYLLTRLVQLGVHKVFQVPGDYVSNFMEALDAFEGIDAVGEVYEMGAAYSADGYARHTGMGAVSLQYGVGTFSAVNAIAGSFVERNPVVVISASPSTESRAKARSQNILFHHSTGNFEADRNVLEQVTVACEIIADAHQAPRQIDNALIAALTHRQPVYLEAYKDVWGDECSRPQGELCPAPRPSAPLALKAAVDETLRRLAAAKHPLLLLGVEVGRYDLQDEVLRLVNDCGLSFTTTLDAKTVLDERHAQFIGTFAGPASLLSTSARVDEADCILAIGVIFTDDYLDLLGSRFEQIIQVNCELARTGAEYYPNLRLTDYVHGLMKALEQDPRFPLSGFAKLPAPRLLAAARSDVPLTYAQFFNTLVEFAEEQHLWEASTLILGESSSLYVASNITGMPRDSFISDAIWGSLGHETGCALGVALASGSRPVVVAGDGGFMMVCQSLAALARNQVNAVVFVMSNRVYAIEQAFVSLDAFEPEGEFAPFDTLPTLDYCALAEGFGAVGCRVETVGQLQSLLPTIFEERDKPVLVEVCIPEKDLAEQIWRLAQT
ncbi:alpha-keto acid decarboxylase family protein [Pseudomonas fontis]|uniref:Thiamine pyrophosphate-binding protein n=1 Tax=Pseudomonas fontis TaxID=2942633 RepID=A0ABT5NYY4_9PSED|nr:thiamine pyrophosphate-binding protein [Pseudomonas fontis]MDD0974004.1 thiamine pyrophosphate-binding protein [Pseudomonas fontis]MDD0993370.1 thiamine pyrophosphate-binding protein [Pseudomonas fontis]